MKIGYRQILELIKVPLANFKGIRIHIHSNDVSAAQKRSPDGQSALHDGMQCDRLLSDQLRSLDQREAKATVTTGLE